MMKYFLVLACILYLGVPAFAQPKEEAVELNVATGVVKGTLLVPSSTKPLTVVLMISGSGPTDRDGNNPMMKNNSLKMLADSLAVYGIASLRYDKRGIAASKDAMKSEADIRFEDYIIDAVAWIKRLKSDKRFKRVIVAGHSEGSLIGMIAAMQGAADAFISLAGVSETANFVIKRQLMNAPGGVADLAFPILDSLAAGKTVEKYPQSLSSLFRPGIQPYMISWFKYDPSKEIAKLSIPILIIQGTTDLQVLVADAEALANANTRSHLAVIENMNHVLKNATSDRMQNISTYSDPALPLPSPLIIEITQFLK